MTTKTIELKNDFHNSYATLRARVMPDGRLFVSTRAMADADKKMCGMSDCMCPGGDIINKDPAYAWEDTGDGYILEACPR